MNETGICFLSSFGIEVTKLQESHCQHVSNILSLQQNGLYMSEIGDWKMPLTKKRGGKLKIEKYKQAFQREETLYNQDII